MTVDLLLGGCVLLLAVSVGWVVQRARAQLIGTTTVRVLAGLCAAALMVMLVTDWPWELLSEFWAGHSVVAGTISTVLLVAIVFLTFEDGERRAQKEVDETVTAAGLGGIVDHLVDLEVALALLSQPSDPSDRWPEWNTSSRPLRWLRTDRSRLHREEGGAPSVSDPRSEQASLPDGAPSDWRAELADQCVRRLLAAMRDWSPLIRGSDNGLTILIVLSDTRIKLMKLGDGLEPGSTTDVSETLSTLRWRLRVLALFAENLSGASQPRKEVLRSIRPLTAPASPLAALLEIEKGSRLHLSRAWDDKLAQSAGELERGHDSSSSSESDSSTWSGKPGAPWSFRTRR